ncbi:recombinase family protein [Kitasatospora purpeofusca]|uniref:recombinase family protein n=1 Tax=Kitasatospora purpeofusca TaxID=67352 RepID=UPI00224E7A93|nr:recombinase family protein [Kitasatospora purpeofusca]MCX4687239.1 recombinase family protein [Kitasatospora purpeofusca]
MTTGSLPGTEGTVFSGRLRGVSAIRLSVLTDETTSPERQREANDRAAEMNNIDFGEGDQRREAVDLDVSASKTAPWERPELGKWIADPATFDVIVWWRFDRAVRSQGDMHELATWASKHRKMIVFAEGVGGGMQTFDFRNPLDPVTRMMLNQFAFAAEMEAWSIKERVTGAQAALRRMPLRWRGGGRPPYGYMPAPMPEEHGGVGWTLVPDPDAVRVIERIVRELLNKRTVSAISAGLNTDGILSPRDYWADKMGRERGGKTGGAKGQHVVRDTFNWTPSVINRLLRNETLLGWKMHKGKPVRDAQGNPILQAETPILTREEFDQIGALLNSRSIDNRDRQDTDALLLRVIHCATCDGRMYLNAQQGKRPNYKCNSHARGNVCTLPANIRGDWVDDYVTAEFLRLVGTIPTTHVVEIPGYDPEPELNATVAEFRMHQLQKGRQKSRHAAEEWQALADALDTRIAELETREKREPQRIVTLTGRTYADEWAKADTTARRTMLVDAGARLKVKRGTRGGWRSLDLRRVEFSVRGELDPAIEEAAGLRTELNMTPETAPTAGSRVRLAEPVAA